MGLAVAHFRYERAAVEGRQLPRLCLPHPARRPHLPCEAHQHSALAQRRTGGGRDRVSEIVGAVGV